MKLPRAVQLAICAAALPIFAIAAAAEQPDPLIGTWKINWDKSVGPPRQQDLSCTFEKTAAGRTWTVYIVDENGKKSTRVSPAIDDGKTYPVTGHEGSDHITLKRIDAHNWQETLWKDGKPAFQGTWKLSEDGKELAIASSVQNYVRVYVKQ
jgi:hypothetical protein